MTSAGAAVSGPVRRGGVRGRIVAMLLVVCAAMVALAAAAWHALGVAEWHAQRVRIVHEQWEATAELSASVNRYSEQIAEILLLGEEERADFLDARADVERAFIRLARLAFEEVAFLEGERDEQQREIRERDNLARQRALYLDIDRRVERMLVLRAAGRRDDAVALFRNEVENRLDAELDASLAEGIKNERAEVARVDAEAARETRNAKGAIVSAAALAVAATLLVGWSLRGTLVRPVLELAEGAQALERGEFGRRVADGHWAGEIGLLAARFNAMASQLEEQHLRLARARDEAEARVRERTKDLEAANSSLKELDRARAGFLADLSHELRTPLTVLRGEAELALRGGSGAAEQREALEVVVRQASQMERMLADLLFLARTETAEARFSKRLVCLQDLLAEAVVEGGMLGRGTAVELIEDGWPDEAVMVDADPSRLKQALMIAVDNAVKYSPPGRAVAVGLRLAGDAGQAEVTVENEGPGLAPDEVAEVFRRFFRGRNARAARSDGSGLGLAIAKSILERHGGTVTLTSARAGPTKLNIALPTARTRGHPDAKAALGRGRSANHEVRPTGA